MSAEYGTPEFSVIIPTHERGETICACLDSLCRLDYPHERFEVIVVDDGSRESPHELVERYADRLPIQFERASHAGPAAARNVGAGIARGAVLVFVADDCRPEPGWLRALARHFADRPATAASGQVLNSTPESRCAEAAQLLNEYLGSWFNTEERGVGFCTPNNLAVPADSFRALGGFDPHFAYAGEDRDFCARWNEAGLRIAPCPDAVVQHVHPLSCSQFLKQQFRYGRGSLRYRRRRAERLRTPLRFERPGFYAGLIAYPIRRRGVAGMSTSILLVMSQLMIGLGAIAEVGMRRRTRPRLAPHPASKGE